MGRLGSEMEEGVEDGEGKEEDSLYASFKSWLMKSELFRRSTISIQESQDKVWVGEIQAASLGLDQFNFGKTLPPKSKIAFRIETSKSGKEGVYRSPQKRNH